MTETRREIAEKRRAVSKWVVDRHIVYCYSDGQMVKEIDCEGKSQHWVSECIENWENGIIKE